MSDEPEHEHEHEHEHDRATETALAAELLEAAKDCDSDAVAALVARGAGTDACDEDGWTALMHSVDAEEEDSVNALLDGGADIDAATPDGGTALIIAIENSYDSCAELLIRRGANLEHANAEGRTALWAALDYGSARTVHRLLDHDARVDTRDRRGRTLLWLAIEEEDVDAAVLLLDRGVPVDAQDDRGTTALMHAVERDQHAMASLLLKQRADRDLRNEAGETALQIAEENGSDRLVALLGDSGIDHARPRAASSPRTFDRRAVASRIVKDWRRLRRAEFFLGASWYGMLLPVFIVALFLVYAGAPLALALFGLSSSSARSLPALLLLAARFLPALALLAVGVAAAAFVKLVLARRNPWRYGALKRGLMRLWKERDHWAHDLREQLSEEDVKYYCCGIESCLRDAREHWRPQSPKLIPALEGRAYHLAFTGGRAQAAEQLDEALAIGRRCFGGEDIRFADQLERYSVLRYLSTGHRDEALAERARAEELLHRLERGHGKRRGTLLEEALASMGSSPSDRSARDEATLARARKALFARKRRERVLCGLVRVRRSSSSWKRQLFPDFDDVWPRDHASRALFIQVAEDVWRIPLRDDVDSWGDYSLIIDRHTEDEPGGQLDTAQLTQLSELAVFLASNPVDLAKAVDDLSSFPPRDARTRATVLEYAALKALQMKDEEWAVELMAQAIDFRPK